MREGMPHRLDPVRRAGRAARARGAAAREARGGAVERAAALRPRPGRRRRRLRRVLPSPRRARGVRPAAGPGRPNRTPAAAVEADGARGGRARRRAGRRVRGRRRVTDTLDGYYGRPIVKEPVWQPEIPFYLFTGGIAGASSVLQGVARLAGNERLAKSALYV